MQIRLKCIKTSHNGDSRRCVFLEGIVFYWISWSIWIAVTFLLDKKNKIRYPLSLGVLLIIIGSIYTLDFGEFSISVTALIILSLTYYFITRLRKAGAIYVFICNLIILLAYCSFLLFELFDPVWVVFDRKWMLSIILVYLTLMVHENHLMRILIILMGTLNGEVLFALIIRQYQFPYIVGSLAFLDVVSMAAAVILLWNALEYIAAYLESYVNPLVKEKQNYHE